MWKHVPASTCPNTSVIQSIAVNFTWERDFFFQKLSCIVVEGGWEICSCRNKKVACITFRSYELSCWETAVFSVLKLQQMCRAATVKLSAVPVSWTLACKDLAH